jgi:hypothetical protein
MTRLYDRGWRQGTVFNLDVTTISSTLVDGGLQAISETHGLWVVSSQDCDVAQVDANSTACCIEIRQVKEGDPGSGLGIRSRMLRLSDDLYVDAGTPRALVAPALLTELAMVRLWEPDASRARAFKTWLGRRYDRPAVQDEELELAHAIAKALREHRTQPIADETHDVLMQIGADSPSYSLFAVVTPACDRRGALEWLTRAALAVDPELGVMAQEPLVLTKAQLSLELLEQSYSADLSDVSWGGSPPRGAT